MPRETARYLLGRLFITTAAELHQVVEERSIPAFARKATWFSYGLTPVIALVTAIEAEHTSLPESSIHGFCGPSQKASVVRLATEVARGALERLTSRTRVATPEDAKALEKEHVKPLTTEDIKSFKEDYLGPLSKLIRMVDESTNAQTIPERRLRDQAQKLRNFIAREAASELRSISRIELRNTADQRAARAETVLGWDESDALKYDEDLNQTRLKALRAVRDALDAAKQADVPVDDIRARVEQALPPTHAHLGLGHTIESYIETLQASFF